jgi:hypothetical protein
MRSDLLQKFRMDGAPDGPPNWSLRRRQFFHFGTTHHVFNRNLYPQVEPLRFTRIHDDDRPVNRCESPRLKFGKLPGVRWTTPDANLAWLERWHEFHRSPQLQLNAENRTRWKLAACTDVGWMALKLGAFVCERRPPGALRTRGRGKYRFEPIAHRRMKKFKLAGRLFRRRGFVVLRHFDQPKLLSLLNN